MSKYAKFTKQGHVGLGGLEWQVQVHENGIDAWLAWHMQLLAQPSQAQFQTESPTPTPTHCSAVGTNWFPAVRAEIVWHSSVQLTSHVWAQDGGRRNVLQFKGDGTKLWSALFVSGGMGNGGCELKIVADSSGDRSVALNCLTIQFSPHCVYAIQWAINKAARAC